MITVKLPETWWRLSAQEWHCEATTVRGALTELFSSFPQLYVHLLENGGRKLQGAALILDDELLLEAEDLSVPLTDGSLLEFVDIPSGEYAETIAFLGTYLGTAAATVVVNTAIAFAVNMALSYLVGLLVGSADMAEYSGYSTNSAANTFNGIRNTTASGTPVGLVYGLHRVGGQILNIYSSPTDTKTEGIPDSTSGQLDTWLFMQIGLCEGEVASVGDVEINKVPAYYYNGVTTAHNDPGNYVRVGNNDQSLMAGFGDSTNSTTMNRKVTFTDQFTFSAGTEAFAAFVPVYGYCTPEGESYTAAVLSDTGRFVYIQPPPPPE